MPLRNTVTPLPPRQHRALLVRLRSHILARRVRHIVLLLEPPNLPHLIAGQCASVLCHAAPCMVGWPGRFGRWAEPAHKGLGPVLAHHRSPAFFGFLFWFKIPEMCITSKIHRK
jgi:hypothetical protein